MKTITEAYKKQWEKMMFSFFNYLPTKYKANREEWRVRKFIWNFKDGKNTVKAAKLVADKLTAMFGEDCKNIVFACIPASSATKNEMRYKQFSDEICKQTGCINAYNAITVEGERLAIHETAKGKDIKEVEVINLNKKFFKGKKVVLFDDVITQGYSYARFACVVEKLGAQVLGGLFLGRTVLKEA